MGMEIVQPEAMDGEGEGGSSRPGILLVGAPAVGKTSILNRLMQSKRAPLSSSAGITSYDWTIDTKYYTANVGILLARLMDPAQSDGDDLMKLQSLSGHCEALVMVFDLSNDASFDCLQQWASRMDLSSFEILLCVGNKADKVPDHYGHTEYRHKVQRRGESSSDPHPEYPDFGIQRTEGSALLSGEEPVFTLMDGKKVSRIAWCVDNGIEYIEACALDELFDDCLSVDGDVQGILRVQGALSAHMWRGLVMKGNLQMPMQIQPRDLSGFSSGDESDFSIQYELLPDEGFTDEEAEVSTGVEVEVLEPEAWSQPPEIAEESDRRAAAAEQQGVYTDAAAATGPHQPDGAAEEAAPQQPSDERSISDKEEKSLEEFENFMREMAGMRENLRSMPDAQRREMASQIAMRMAAMFSDGDEGD